MSIELLEIAKHQEFKERIFPLILPNANIFDALERLKYIKYWEEKIQKLDQGMKEVGSANLQGFREDIDLYTAIRNQIAELTNLLKDMNAQRIQDHRIHGGTDQKYGELFQVISQQLEG